MTPDDLRHIGEALYGERWQTPLARDLGVNDRTMRRWVAGSWPVPPDRADEIRAVARRRGQALLEATTQVS